MTLEEVATEETPRPVPQMETLRQATACLSRDEEGKCAGEWGTLTPGLTDRNQKVRLRRVLRAPLTQTGTASSSEVWPRWPRSVRAGGADSCVSEEDRTWIIWNTSCMISRHLSGQVGKQTAMLGLGRGHKRLNLKHTVLRDEPFNIFFCFHSP